MKSRFTRRLACGALLAGTIALAAGNAFAQTTNFPQRPVKLLAPFPAGGSSDVMLRQIAEGLHKLWNQPVVVEPKPGAAGILVGDALARAEPDGHTAMLHVSGMVYLPALHAKIPFDPLTDFAPVSQVATMPLVFATHPSVPAKTLKEFVALAKAQPGKLNFGSFGTGSAGHLYMEILKDAANIDILHVPYKGEAPELTDLIGGQISSAILSLPGSVPYANSGKLIPLAVTGPTRAQQLPNTPTFVEGGFNEPVLESVSWYGIFLPAKTPKAIVDKFSRDLRTVLASPELKQRMQAYGMTLTGSTPEALAELMKTDSARWTKVIRDNNIKVN